MYLLHIIVEGCAYNGDRRVSFLKRRDALTLPKWTYLGNDRAGRELLRLIAVALGGEKRVDPDTVHGERARGRRRTITVAYAIARHYPQDAQTEASPVLGGGVTVDAGGHVDGLRRMDLPRFLAGVPARRLHLDKGVANCLLLGYGPGQRPGREGEDFEFTDPLFRRKRYGSLLMPEAALTHPGDFIARLRYKGIRWGRRPAKNVLHALCTQLFCRLHMETAPWSDAGTDPGDAWNRVPPRDQRAALPILDMARHLMDAFPKTTTPLNMPGVVLLDRPEASCGPGRLTDYLAMMDELFPLMQFIVCGKVPSARCLSESLWKKRLPLPAVTAPPKPRGALLLSKGTVLLIDVDGKLPNLALMKLSAHFKATGKTVWLGRRDCFLDAPDRVFASSLFYAPGSERRREALKRHYGDRLTLGGTGEDIGSRLPDAVEALAPDYSLYPELGDRAIGFVTRGCPFSCPFCVVPRKEGPPRQVCDLDTLLEGGRRNKLILLDDNILSHPDADRLLAEMAQRRIRVNFTQTLDLRLVDRARAILIRRIPCSNTRFTRITYHFSLNHNRGLDLVSEKYRLFSFTPKDNVHFVCMYGYDTTLEEDVHRFEFLRSLPGAYVFTQKYLPLRDGPEAGSLDFFGPDPDPWIDRLIAIVFRQNMKSMENYYRWVSRRYADAYGRLHRGLVDAIFRYNNRHMKGAYLASLAGTRTVS